MGNEQPRIFVRCRNLRLLRAFLVTATLMAGIGAPAGAHAVDVAMLVRERIGQLRSGELTAVQGEIVGGLDVMEDFYAARDYQPAWTDAGRVDELLALLDAASEHGLEPEDFFSSRLHALSDSPDDDAVRVAERDLLLSEALIRYGYQRRFGKVDPRTMEPAWNFSRGFAENLDPAVLLAEAMAAPALPAFLDEKLPASPRYRQLQRSLAHYRSIEALGGWPALAGGPALHTGEQDRRVSTLRERLLIEGDLPAGTPVPDPQVFDEALGAAVRMFQRRHALAADAVVGARTRAALNVPASERIAQIRLSLERMRWLRGDIPPTYVMINVAGFQVGFVEDFQLMWSSRVVVGRSARQTPIFRGLMTYVELNPTWTLPPTILREDVLPAIRRDPAYLRKENISVFDHSGRRLDPTTIDWQVARPGSHVLRQEPGPDNALGRIKLMFPNRHAVYLHDTPAKQLFDRPERSFSSGCIRVEDPLALAELVLDSPQWRRADLEAEIATGMTRRIDIEKPVPVLVVYLTAVTDTDGRTYFYRDIYGRDPALLTAMAGPVRLDMPGPAARSSNDKR